MKLRSTMHLFLPTLALSMILAMGTTAQAQDRRDQGSSGASVTLRINVGSAPHWEQVPGTRVRAIRRGDRVDYDVFQYGRKYYAYNYDNNRWYVDNNPWYRFGRWSGQFRLIDDRYVPIELRRIPRTHWRHYPEAWQDRYDQGPGGTSAFLQITFGRPPRWVRARGTQVDYLPSSEYPNHDVFRYGGTFYAYSGNRWYSSPRESGNFTMIDERAVPSELTKVPRQHWRNYPAGWGNQQGNPPSNRDGQKQSKGRGSQGKGNGRK